MKFRMWIGVWSLLFMLTSCGGDQSSNSDHQEQTNDDDPPEITGFVMEEENDRILVVAPMASEDDGGARAMWVSGVSGDTWIGKHVEVWVQGEINESYPEQAEAKQVSVLEMSDVEGADLEAYEVLSNALSDLSTPDILSVKKIAFDSQADEWIVQLSKVSSGSGEVEKLIPDQK